MAEKSRYTLIKGKYWIHYPDRPRQGPQPDGDTVRFQPDNPELVRALPWFSGTGPDFNTRGNIAVRYEGIDALETHFGDAHQELQFAKAARAENLRLLGFTNVSYFSDRIKTSRPSFSTKTKILRTPIPNSLNTTMSFVSFRSPYRTTCEDLSPVLSGSSISLMVIISRKAKNRYSHTLNQHSHSSTISSATSARSSISGTIFLDSGKRLSFPRN